MHIPKESNDIILSSIEIRIPLEDFHLFIINDIHDISLNKVSHDYRSLLIITI